jgi:hypothetical protein
MYRLLSFLLIGILFSCTILEDSDITSLEGLKKLRLTSVQITEAINDNVITKTAVATETTIDETLPNGVRITKRKTIAWPALTNFQFRSGASSGITLVSEYLANGKVKFWRVLSDQDTLETYEFKYNSNGILNFLVTKIKDKTTHQLIVDDSDLYELNQYNFPQQRNPFADPSKKNKAVWGGDKISINSCGFSYVWQYYLECTTATPSVCSWKNKKEYNYCSSDNFYVVTQTGSPGGAGHFKIVENGELIEDVYLGEDQNNGSCCGDQYYFHPYLFMPGDIRIKILYAPDWWKEDITNDGNIRKSIRLKFNYEI